MFREHTEGSERRENTKFSPAGPNNIQYILFILDIAPQAKNIYGKTAARRAAKNFGVFEGAPREEGGGGVV